MNKRQKTCNCEHLHVMYILCSQDKLNLINLGLVCLVKKLYIKYEKILEDMRLLYRQTVF